MGQFQQSKTFDLTIPGPTGTPQTVTITTTYTATYLDAPKGPGILKQDLKIEPCDFADRPEFDTQLLAKITEWTKTQHTDARVASGVETAKKQSTSRNRGTCHGPKLSIC